MPDQTLDADRFLTEHRRDRGFLRAPVRTAQGFLLAEGVAAIAGIHDYILKDSDGNPRMVRELFAPAEPMRLPK